MSKSYYVGQRVYVCVDWLPINTAAVITNIITFPDGFIGYEVNYPEISAGAFDILNDFEFTTEI